MMAKPWNEHRHIITRLYIHDGKKLEDVRVLMKEKYGFEASIRSYRQHFDQWNVGKYNCKKRTRRRQQQANMVPRLLPSPPPTPLVGMATPMGMAAAYHQQHHHQHHHRQGQHHQGHHQHHLHDHGGGLLIGSIRLPSPESLSSSSPSSVRSSISSISMGMHSPDQQRALPDISSLAGQHPLVQMPSSRFPPYYASQHQHRGRHAAADVLLRQKPGLAMHQPLLADRPRTSSVVTGEQQHQLPSPPTAPVGLARPDTKPEAKFAAAAAATYPEPSSGGWGAHHHRSTTPAAATLQEYPWTGMYSSAGARCVKAEPATTPRSMDLRAVMASPDVQHSLPKLPESPVSQPERTKDHQDHVASSPLSYQGLVTP